MGGYGSGRDAIRNRKSMVEDFLVIDSGELKHFDGLLRPEALKKGVYKQINSSPLVEVLIFGHQAELRIRENNANWGAVSAVMVSLTWSGCHFGGRRVWFLCPGRHGKSCDRRVGKLYVVEGALLCRHCSELVYESQYHQISGSDFRQLDKAEAIRIRLGDARSASADFPKRPKGMHIETYERLSLKYYGHLDAYTSAAQRDQARSWALLRHLGIECGDR